MNRDQISKLSAAEWAIYYAGFSDGIEAQKISVREMLVKIEAEVLAK